jgi:acetyl-CoA/propionyl-CoA carboxylase biotin carboxyl carrier protein
MAAAATAFARTCGYVGAGTVEMLVDPSSEAFYFLEMNARLQVEHTVTEEVLGLDLVACQLLIAAGEWPAVWAERMEARGHAIECRINAEDPGAGFAPAPGLITGYREPSGLGVRVDSGYGAGDEIPGAYDSLLAKLVVWGADRKEALRRMHRALDDFLIEGVATTVPAHKALLSDAAFISGVHTTATVPEVVGRLEPAPSPESAAQGVVTVDGRQARLWHPAMAAASWAAAAGDGTAVVAPLQAVVLEVLVSEGEVVAEGAALVKLEAMKMETVVAAPREATVTRVAVAAGETVPAGGVVVELNPHL